MAKRRETDPEVAALNRCVTLIAALASPESQERVASYLYERFTDAPVEFTLGRPSALAQEEKGAQ